MSKNIKNRKNIENPHEETQEERIARLKANEKRRARQLAARTGGKKTSGGAKTEQPVKTEKPQPDKVEKQQPAKAEKQQPEKREKQQLAGQEQQPDKVEKQQPIKNEKQQPEKTEKQQPDKAEKTLTPAEEKREALKANEKRRAQQLAAKLEGKEAPKSGSPVKKSPSGSDSPVNKSSSKSGSTVTSVKNQIGGFSAKAADLGNKIKNALASIVISEANSNAGKLVAAAAAVVIVLGYFIGATYYTGHFFPKTYLNGVNVSGCSNKKAIKKIEETVADYTLTLKEKDGSEEMLYGSGVNAEAEVGDNAKTLIKSQNSFAWPFKLFRKHEISLQGLITYDDVELQAEVNDLDCMSAAMQVMPTNATVSAYDAEKGFSIVKETEGTAVDKEALLKAVETAVTNMDASISLEDEGIYYEPTVFSDDKALAQALKKMNSLLDSSITYQAGSKTEVLDASTYAYWMEIDENGEITLNAEEVEAYVDNLALKFNDYYSPKEFKTSTGKTVTISDSEYGWMIAKPAEREALVSDILSGQQVTREPNYKYTANSHDAACWGDTYVEVNITKQHVWFYSKGKLVIDCPCVTGNETEGNGTPTGIYSVDYCQRDATLVGENYESAVSYWMPFNGNVGLHDASWRRKFGGDIYEYAGSHGCVNLPVDAAAAIFAEIHQGCPVLVFKEE